MYKKNAGIKEWMDWMAQPIHLILKDHKDLIYGPVDDLMDEVLRLIAPQIVKAIGEREIDEDVEEFLGGAQEGRFDALSGYLADPDLTAPDDEQEGYNWGFSHAEEWKGKTLPSDVERKVVQDQIKEFRSRVTEEVVIDLMEKTWHAISPSHTIKAIIKAVKKHGWKIGVGFVIFEIVEHALLPAVMIKLTGNPKWALLGTLPIGEIIYALALRVLGKADKGLDKLDEDGHLDWYEAKYGPVRLASQYRRPSCGRVAHRYRTGG